VSYFGTSAYVLLALGVLTQAWSALFRQSRDFRHAISYFRHSLSQLSGIHLAGCWTWLPGPVIGAAYEAAGRFHSE
jgi:hypothetical protein